MAPRPEYAVFQEPFFDAIIEFSKCGGRME